MDGIDNSASYRPSSPVTESPLMQLANASVSVMRASLSPKEIKPPPDIEPKSPSLLITTTPNPHLSLLGPSRDEPFKKTHVQIQKTVPTVSKTSAEKTDKESPFDFPGTENETLEKTTRVRGSKARNTSSQATGSHVDYKPSRNDGNKQHLKKPLPLNKPDITKSSVSKNLSSKANKIVTSHQTPVASNVVTHKDISPKDANFKKATSDPDSISQQTSSLPTTPRLNLIPNQITLTHSPIKASTLKLTTSKTEKTISLLNPELVPKTSYSAAEIPESLSLTQKNLKLFSNQVPKATATIQETYQHPKSNPQITTLSNVDLTPVSQILCSLSSQTPLVLSETTTSLPTTFVLHSRPSIQVSAVAQASTTHNLLNKSNSSGSQKIAEDIKNASDVILDPSTDLPFHTSTKTSPGSSITSLSSKSTGYVPTSPVMSIANINSKDPNPSQTHFTSGSVTNPVPSANQSETDKKDISSGSSFFQATETNTKVQIPNKSSFPMMLSEKVKTVKPNPGFFSSQNDKTIPQNPESKTEPLDGLSTSIGKTTASIALSVQSILDSVAHSFSTRTTCCTTFSTPSASFASCTPSVSACIPSIRPSIAATSQPKIISISSNQSFTKSGTTCSTILTTPSLSSPVTSSNPSTHHPSTITSESSNPLYISGVSTNTLINPSPAVSASFVASPIPGKTTESPKKRHLLQEYKITSPKLNVDNSRVLNNKPPLTFSEDKNPTSNTIDKDLQNEDKKPLQTLETLATVTKTDAKQENGNSIADIRSNVSKNKPKTKVSSAVTGTKVSSIIETAKASTLAVTDALPSTTGSKTLVIAETTVLTNIAETEAISENLETETVLGNVRTEAVSASTRTEAASVSSGTDALLVNIGTQELTPNVKNKVSSTNAKKTKASSAKNKKIYATSCSMTKSEVPSVKTKAEVPSVKTKAEVPSVKTKAEVPSVKTKAEVPSVKTKAEVPSVKTKAEVPFKTKAKVPSVETKAKVPSVKTKAEVPSVKTKAEVPFKTKAEVPSVKNKAEVPFKTKAKVPSVKTKAEVPLKSEAEVPSVKTKAEVPFKTKAEVPSVKTKAEVPFKTKAEVPSVKTKAEVPFVKAEAEIPQTPTKTIVIPDSKTEAHSTIGKNKVSSSIPHELVTQGPEVPSKTKSKPISEKKGTKKQIPSDQSSKRKTLAASQDASTKRSPTKKVDKKSTPDATPECSTLAPSERSTPAMPSSDSAISDVSSVFSEDKKITPVDIYSSVGSLVSEEPKPGPSPRKLPKKSKKSEPESKMDTSPKKRRTSSNSSVSSTTTCAKETTSPDLPLLPSPKPADLLKDDATIRPQKEKEEEAQVSVGGSEGNNPSVKKESPISKPEACGVSTRPRRIIKARHLFSSSSYSTGSTKSESSAGESASSLSKQRKKSASSAEDEKKSKTSHKKSNQKKTVTDEETESSPKKTARRRTPPTIKKDSPESSKSSPLVKSPNSPQVTSAVPTGYTYLLTALNTKKDSAKIVKTPTMGSNSGVTSTSPTYSNSKRNVTTKCSTTKEQKSPEINSSQTDKTCISGSISTPRPSNPPKTTNISNVDGNQENLADKNELDILTTTPAKPSNRKRKNSTSTIGSESNSIATKSSDDLSQHIAEAEKLIKKEPIDSSETENDPETITPQNPSSGCGYSRDTHEIRKLLNAGCNNNNSNINPPSLGKDLALGNNSSQNRPLAPVQLSSPYAIFLPVSLSSGATTPLTTTSTSAPLYSIQLNVPNVVRMGKPFLPNDPSIAKKHCTIVPAPICPKTDPPSIKSTLISRSNLIPTYYPAPLPESLMNKVTVNYHACVECGDTFLFKSSLDLHKTRKCMQFTYNCDNCTMKLVFYNKCSVLEHIRSHYPTRPITIKLEKMEVTPLAEGITDILETEDESRAAGIGRDPEETTKFDCTECGAKFHNARALADHFGHSEIVCSFSFYCALCQTYLPRHCAQLAHRRVHHEKPPHVCPECGQLFSNIFPFREHLKLKCMHFSRIAPLTCPKCLSKFCYTPELKEHIISVHSETFIKCSICPMAFKASASYQTHHLNTHASEVEQKKEIYKCPLCDTVFHSIQQLMNHVDIHIGELKKGVNYAFRCSICSSIFAKRSQLVSHLCNSHHLDYVQHRCEFCDCVCKTAHNLQTHQRAIHKVEFKKYESAKTGKVKGETAAAKSKKLKNTDLTHCSLCHIFFATLSQLEMHTRKVHQKKASSSVPESDSGSASSISLAPASKSKNSQKYCRYCKAPYKSWSRLMQHILAHRNSGVYICLICTNAAFISREELSKHEEFCSGENLYDKPPTVYECKECHQLFKQESWLIAHQKNIHPKKGPFTCDLCDLSYKSNSSLQKHMQTVHEDDDEEEEDSDKKSLSCFMCKAEKTFRSQSQLERHLTTKHKMSLDEMKAKQCDIEKEHSENNVLLKKNNKRPKPSSGSGSGVPAKKSKSAPSKPETYICAKCNFSSQNFNLFQQHIQEHKTSEDGLQCDTCGLCFAATDSLRMHLFAVHKIKCSNDSLREKSPHKTPNPNQLEDSKYSSEEESSSSARSTPLTNVPAESTNTSTVEPSSKTDELVNNSSNNNANSNLESCQCNVCYKTFETDHLLKVHMRTHGMAFIRSKRLNMSD